MKRRFTKPAAVLLASLLLTASAATTASAAIAGPSAPTFTSVMRHTPKTLFPVPGAATITVTDEETGLPVAGAKYDLYRKSLYGGVDSKIGTYTTDKNGKITVSHAMTGTFYWVAASETEGYAADDDKHDFTVLGAQFADAAAVLAKPAPEPEPEPANDGYVALNADKTAAMAAIIDEQGTFYEEGDVSFNILGATYALSDERHMEVDFVHYLTGSDAEFAVGRSIVDDETGKPLTFAIMTLTDTAEKYFTYTGFDGVKYYMTFDGRTFAFSQDPDAAVWSADYEDITAYYYEDDTEAPKEIRDKMILELKGLIVEFGQIASFWGMDITVDDIGLPMHDLAEAVTFEADAE